MKRILNVIGGLNIGGAENSAMNICRYIDKDYFQYDYLVFGEEEGVYEKEALHKGAEIIRMPFAKEGYFLYCKNISKLLKENKYDAIHVNTLWNSGIVLFLAKIYNVPVRICHSHSTESSQNEGIIYKVYIKVMRKLITSSSTHLIACGQEAGEYLYGKELYQEAGTTIYNGIDINDYRFDQTKRNDIRSSFGLEATDTLLGHVGRLAPVKNHSFILDIFEEMATLDSTIYLMLVGDGPDQQKIKDRILASGLEKRVFLMGNRLNVNELLFAMDVMLFPSLYEGFPVTLIEAQATALPCLISEQVTNEAKLIEISQFLPIDAGTEIWKENIYELIQKKIQRDYTSIEYIEKNFNVKNIVKKMERLYHAEY
ncbi:MAG: hypothetical protein PWR19_1979 [Carnobacterium sp.]|uniref:glycosyltransferase family 1 protein n=1 Tax=Carnobacterium sp. TaxID=48221 RepID=UPI00264977BE|nr:glycosyltransferase family 1 protein [Carnobacterium sp.]MDN5372933.1 hypothetical protein [Carnobacterium sp.]